MKYNPFRPGSIVYPGVFAGRLEEITAIERILLQTKLGNAQHFIIDGERGIGKSSLMYYVSAIARGQIEYDPNQYFNFICVSIELEPSTTYGDLIRKIAMELLRELEDHKSKLKKVSEKSWDFLKRVEAFGVKYQVRSESEMSELLEELVHLFEQTLRAKEDDVDGITVFIDEADRPGQKAELGEFAKVFTERLQKRGCDQVCLGLSGIGIVPMLRQSHESAPRIFQTFTLDRLSGSEMEQVVHRALLDATEKSSAQWSIEDSGMRTLQNFAEGLPHFLQQGGYCAVEADDDFVLDRQDVLKGIRQENGALDQLGKCYFSDLYFDKIFSDKYRKVLEIMADLHIKDKLAWISKTAIRETADLPDTTLSNALKALRERNIIQPREGTKGEYRLPNTAFAVWIRNAARK